MRYRNIVVVASGVLVLLVVILFVSLESQRQGRERLTGTYSTAGSQPVDGEYYVLEPDGTYTRYRQFQILEQGAYQTDIQGEAKIVTLSGSAAAQQLLHVNGRLYAYTANGTIAAFEKISDQSVYINISK